MKLENTVLIMENVKESSFNRGAKLGLVLCFVLAALSFSKAQVNMFNRQLIYKPDLSCTDYSALKQTVNKGYIICRSSVDSLYPPNNHYSEIMRMDKTGQSVWRKRLFKGFTPDTSRESSTSVTTVNDGHFLLATSVYDSIKRPQICVLKIDSMGNVMWSKKYLTEGLGVVYSVKQTSDNGFILSGSTKKSGTNKMYALALKINSNGNLMWGNKSAEADSIGAAFYNVTEVPGQGYVFAGYSEKSAILLRTDMMGNVVWNKRFFNGSVGYLNSIIYTSDNSLLITGQNKLATMLHGSYFIAKLDINGNFLWAKADQQTASYSGGYGSDIKERNNEYYFLGYVANPIPSQMLGKISANGNLIWCKNFYSTFHSFNYESGTLEATLDGGFSFATIGGIFPSIYSTAFVKTDASGNAGCDIHNYAMILNTLTITPLSGFTTSACAVEAAVTLTLSNTVPHDSLMCATILDPMTTGIQDVISLSEVKVYPNPGNGIFTISIDKMVQNGRLVVLNMMGEQIHTQRIESGESTVNMSKQAAGAYFYKLIESRQVIKTGKLIIQ